MELFAGLNPDVVEHMARDLARSFENEARLRGRVLTYAERVKEEAEKSGQPGRTYRKIEPSYASAIQDYNEAVTQTETKVEVYSNVAWGCATSQEEPWSTEQGKDLQGDFEAWVRRCREKGGKRA